ncbi:MAG TPA: protein translocase subunit SecF [Gemmatimonadales bacterium]|nr:protein translocase subunit SecF [Gemmatimonadales bacterium]
MIRFFAHANYDFIALRRWAYGLTAALIIPGLLHLFIAGLNYSIEFTGGTLVQVEAQQPVNVGRLRGALDAAGLRGAEIQTFQGSNEFTVRARASQEAVPAGADVNNTEVTGREVRTALDQAVGAGKYTVVHTEAVGPKVGGELRQKAFMAIFLSFFAVLAYLAVRFEWRFGLAAVIATAHDIVATIAFISVMRLEVSLTVVAAVLSMVGYSLNDTIIIFDRARENLKKHPKDSFKDILNRSVNETLPRSVLTHGTTLATLLALVIFGGEVIRPFALVMFFGVFTGTFSSIYIASPVLMAIEEKWPGPHGRRGLAAKAPAGRPAPRPAQPVEASR